MSASGEVGIRRGYKFALLSVAEAGSAPQTMTKLSAKYFVSSVLPPGVLDTWRANIGRLHERELEETRLFLWALKKSKSPGVLDRENDRLAEDVYRLYLGVLLATPYFSNGRMTLLTGANADGTARARTFTFYSRSYRTLGVPHHYLSVGRLREAETIAASLAKLSRSPHRHRMERTIRAFREACEADRLDHRIHQFVRCAEGFAVPYTAVQFTQRLKKLCVRRCKPALKQLYDIRSGIEHLHGPYDRLPKRPKPGKVTRLLQRCVQAEILARFLITTYLSQPTLWPWFSDRAAIDGFWAQSDKQLHATWPRRLAFPSATSVLDPAALRQARNG